MFCKKKKINLLNYMKTYIIGVDIFPFALGSNMVPPGSLGSCLHEKFLYSVHYGFLQVFLIFESTALIFILITEIFGTTLSFTS